MELTHKCSFHGHKRTSPTGSNKKGISFIASSCRCGKMNPKFPEKLSYWEKRWIKRFNKKMEDH